MHKILVFTDLSPLEKALVIFALSIQQTRYKANMTMQLMFSVGFVV